jgi:antitoxin VapB
MILPSQEESSMPINIKDSATDAKVRELAALTGESITDAVRIAIEQRLRRESPRRRAGVAERLLALGASLSARPRLLDGDADAAIGCDMFGAPK